MKDKISTVRAEGEILSNGVWQLDLGRRELLRDGQPVTLGSRAMEVLEVLARAGGRLVTKDALMQAVWPGSVVGENTLHVHVLAGRKALGKDRGLLQTVHGRGYRLLGEWRRMPGKTMTAPPAAAGNLPAARDELIGREAVLEEVAARLATVRLLTLTGTGGIGKTRLALEAARHWRDEQAGEALLVELASLADGRLVPATVAGVLGLELGGAGLSPGAVAEAIGHRRMLLLLDNCEHVIEPAALLVERILRACPQVVVLATSREVLQLEGEHVLRVPPLAVPEDDDAELGPHSAVQLFQARMQARSGATPDGALLSTIGAICRRLDGIPLAIELAAARAAALGVAAVHGLLDERFNLLTDGRRHALPQHRTLRATLDWSYQLLPEDEARLLRRLAVFPAGFTVEGAAAVHDHPAAPLEGVANLVAKSLLVLEDSQPCRWRMLETTRAYALEKLTEAGEFDAASSAQARHLRQLLAPTLAWHFGGQNLALSWRELDNVRAALDWAYARPEEARNAVVLTASCVPVWLQRFMLAECGERVEQALQRLPQLAMQDPLLRARILTMLGFALLNTAGRAAQIRTVVTEALAIAETLDDVDLHFRALWANWSLHLNAGDYRAARPLAERFLAVARETGDADAVRVGHRLLGSVLHFAGDQNAARVHLEQSLAAGGEAENARRAVWFLLDQRLVGKAMLARVMAMQGALEDAARLADESLKDAMAAEHRLSVCYALRNAVCPIAFLTADAGQAQRSVARLGEMVHRHGLLFWRGWSDCLEGQARLAEGRATEAVTLLQRGVAARTHAGWTMRNPEFLGALAEALAAQGAADQALEVLAEALRQAARGGQGWCVPELQRLQARFLMAARGDARSAATILREALHLARRQGARLWERRVSDDLDRLCADAAARCDSVPG